MNRIESCHTMINDAMNRLSAAGNDWTFKRLRNNLYAAYHSGYREALINLRMHEDHMDLVIYDVGPIEFVDGSLENHLHLPNDLSEEAEKTWFEDNLIVTLNKLHGIT